MVTGPPCIMCYCGPYSKSTGKASGHRDADKKKKKGKKEGKDAATQGTLDTKTKKGTPRIRDAVEYTLGRTAEARARAGGRKKKKDSKGQGAAARRGKAAATGGPRQAPGHDKITQQLQSSTPPPTPQRPYGW